MAKKVVTIPDVKPITFEGHHVSADGELLVFRLRDRANNTGWIAVRWEDLGFVRQMIDLAGREARKARKNLGKSDDYTVSGPQTAQLVEGYQVSVYPEKKLKVLTLRTPTGFRCDFAIRTDLVDQLGRPMTEGIAEELTEDKLGQALKHH
ncbi:MAG: hypothetical protein AB7S41_11380 [Parvibaculaceae bacterium]